MVIHIAAGNGAWRWAGAALADRLVLVAPPGEDPNGLDWRVIRGHSVVIVQVGQLASEHLERIAIVLLHAGADRVIALPQGGRILRFTRAAA